MFKKVKRTNFIKKVSQSNLARNITTFLLSTKLQGRLIARPYHGGNQDYQKYIIMCHPRSGSQMLTAVLRQHSQIISFGELSHPREIMFNNREYNSKSKPLLLFRHIYPTYFLDHLIFSAYSENIRAVGFKVFLSHLERGPFSPVWEWLNYKKDVKVIFLTRRNLLNAHTSMAKDRKTGIYDIIDTSGHDKTNVTLDYEKLVKQFNRHSRRSSEAFSRLSDHYILRIAYEEMISDYNYNLKKIQKFLKVDFEPHKPIHKKQEVRPLSEVITNYEELKGLFIDTEWSTFFDT